MRNLTERAIDMVGVYWQTLRKGKDPSKFTGHSAFESKRRAAKYSQNSWNEHQRWEKAAEGRWRRQGRIAGDGTLRISGAPVPPWTLEHIAQLWPHLKPFDLFATLVQADGVVPQGFMDANENIQAVIEELVDRRIAVIFGGVLMNVRKDQAAAAGEGQLQPHLKRRSPKQVIPPGATCPRKPHRGACGKKCLKALEEGGAAAPPAA